MSDDVRLRDVEEPDLEVFFEHQVDPEAVRLPISRPGPGSAS
jgi:hypothetical protein